MNESSAVLRQLPLFEALSDESLAAIAQRTILKKVARNSILFRIGESCQGLYIVMEGSIRVYRANPAGQEQVLHTQGHGQPLAEVPLFDSGPYPATARAIEDSVVLFLPIADFQQLYRSHPEIAESTIRELGRRLRRMVGLVEKISLKDVPARVAVTLLEHSERASLSGDARSFNLHRTQEQLAAELATTRESIARALSGLRKAKIIEQRGARIRILDLNRLRKEAVGGRV